MNPWTRLTEARGFCSCFIVHTHTPWVRRRQALANAEAFVCLVHSSTPSTVPRLSMSSSDAIFAFRGRPHRETRDLRRGNELRRCRFREKEYIGMLFYEETAGDGRGWEGQHELLRGGMEERMMETGKKSVAPWIFSRLEVVRLRTHMRLGRSRALATLWRLGAPLPLSSELHFVHDGSRPSLGCASSHLDRIARQRTTLRNWTFRAAIRNTIPQALDFCKERHTHSNRYHGL